MFNCVHYFLLNKTNPEGKIIRKDLKAILGVSFHIPKDKKESLIRELKNYNIITNNERDNFEINKKIFW